MNFQILLHVWNVITSQNFYKFFIKSVRDEKQTFAIIYGYVSLVFLMDKHSWLLSFPITILLNKCQWNGWKIHFMMSIPTDICVLYICLTFWLLCTLNWNFMFSGHLNRIENEKFVLAENCSIKIENIECKKQKNQMKSAQAHFPILN